jgi:hypothetical protein
MHGVVNVDKYKEWRVGVIVIWYYKDIKAKTQRLLMSNYHSSEINVC